MEVEFKDEQDEFEVTVGWFSKLWGREGVGEWASESPWLQYGGKNVIVMSGWSKELLGVTGFGHRVMNLSSLSMSAS